MSKTPKRRMKGAWMPDDRLLTRAELLIILRTNSDTFSRWVREKRVPQPDVKTTQKNQQWKVSSLRAAGLNI
jgi:hypothetical protein